MSKIKVQGNASGSGTLTIEAPNTNTDRTITLPDDTGTLVHANASGNVGIGTSSPGRSLHVTSNVNTPALRLSSGSSYTANYGPSIEFQNGTGEILAGIKGAFEYTSQGNYGVLTFSTRTSDALGIEEKMRIDSSGNVLVGTTSGYTPTTKQTIAINSSSGIGLAINANANGNWATAFQNASGTNVGQIVINASSTSYNTSSDYRLKENVVPMTGSIDRLKQLKPCNFNFIADPDTTVDGFLAHEAQKVVPEAVSGEKDAMRTEEYEVTPAVEATYDEDGNELTPAVEAVMGEREVEDYQGIDQAKLVPLLTSALQEAVAKIEALETTVSDLTTRIETLENA